MFIVAGEGPMPIGLRQRATALGLDDNVRFVGNLDRRTRLLDCYKAGDVFLVFASPTETQGLVLIEAMCAWRSDRLHGGHGNCHRAVRRARRARQRARRRRVRKSRRRVAAFAGRTPRAGGRGTAGRASLECAGS
jgi:glycosyltransferase involved in cell wall biosynthesis